jgi:RNA polymerase sigma factor (sigma-70 family)
MRTQKNGTNGTWHGNCSLDSAADGCSAEGNTTKEQHQQRSKMEIDKGRKATTKTTGGDGSRKEGKREMGPEELNREVLANEGLVCQEVLRFTAKRTGKATMDEDLRQEGLIGLWKAILGYDRGKGAAFSSYAVPSIRRHIQREWEKRSRSAAFFPASLQDPVGEDEDCTLGDLCADPNTAAPDAGIVAEERKEEALREVDSLPEAERTVVEHYFGLRGRERLNLPAIARKLDKSVQYIHRVLHRALGRMDPDAA